MKQKLLFILFTILTLSFNGHAQWSLGDVAFSAYGSETATNTPSGPIDAFTIVLLRSVTSGEELAFTENGWFAAGGFRSGENTITLEFTSSYTEGTQIIVGTNGGTSTLEARDDDGLVAGIISGSTLSLATGGDQIFVYDPANMPTSNANQSGFIAAIHMNGDWDADSTSATTSAQPTVFTDGVNSISIAPEVDSARVSMSNCANFSDINTLRTMLNTASNWETDNTTAYDQSTPVCDFKQTLGIEQAQPLVNAVRLTPNPVQNTFSLIMGSNGNSIDKLEVYSITGQNVLRLEPISNNTLVNMSNFRSGIYLAKIYAADKVIVKKVIKQ
ncbi:MAG: T9SS type A sorting domain-containing protein [Bacteroidota bacterium]